MYIGGFTARDCQESMELKFEHDVRYNRCYPLFCFLFNYLIGNVRKRIFGHFRSAKIQISLRMRAGWSESSLGAFWIAKDAKFLHAYYEDSDQTVWMHRLFWMLAWHKCQTVHFLTLRFNHLDKCMRKHMLGMLATWYQMVIAGSNSINYKSKMTCLL